VDGSRHEALQTGIIDAIVVIPTIPRNTTSTIQPQFISMAQKLLSTSEKGNLSAIRMELHVPSDAANKTWIESVVREFFLVPRGISKTFNESVIWENFSFRFNVPKAANNNTFNGGIMHHPAV
jgi:hypothetical protein